MLKKLLRLPIQISVFIIFLIVLILGLAQMQFVRDKIRDILVSELNKSLNGQVYIAQVRGNFINYLELSGVALKLDKDYIFKADAATIKLNPFALLDNKIVVNEFRLINPDINLEKTASGKWNYELISKGEPDTSTSESNLAFDLSGIEIINGSLKFDTKESGSPTNGFNASKFNLEVLNLSVNFKMDKDSKQVEIGHISCIQDRKNVLNELSGKIKIDKHGINVDTLNLEFNKTFIRMSVSLKDVDLDKDTLSLEKLGNKKVKFNIKGSNIDTKDIEYFVPAVDMLSGNYNIDLSSSGTLKDLYVQRMELKTDNSTLRLSGNIYNIDKPEDMKFNVSMTESEFDLADLRNNLLPLDLPDYSAAGKVKLNLKYTGKANVFESDISIEGNFGSLKGKVNLDLEAKIPTYKLALVGNALNLKPFLGPEFDSRLNCRITGSGAGFEVSETNSEMEIAIDSSRFLHQPIDRSKISVTFINKHCNALIAFSGGNTKIGLNTEFNLNKRTNQSYIFNLSINNLDLSKFTNDPNLSSNINISSAINGEYLSIDKTTGQALIYIFPSWLKNDTIPELSFNIKYDQTDPEDRRISLYSQIADIDLKGKFEINSITNNLKNKLMLLSKDISNYLPFPKQAATEIAPTKLQKHWALKKTAIKTKLVSDTIDIDYSIHLKNLESVKKYLNCKDINTNIKIEGKLSSGTDNISLTGIANVDNLFFLSSTNNVLVQDLDFKYSVSSSSADNMLFNMNNNISLKLPIAYFNKNTLRNIDFNLTTRKNKSDISLSGNFDTKTDFDLKGSLVLSKESHELEFTKVNLKHSNYEWNNKGNISCSIRSNGFDIQSLTLAHADEEIVLEGSISQEGEQNLSLLVNNLRIENIMALTSSDSLEQAESLLSGKLNLRGEIFGTATDPLMNLYIKTDSLSTNNKYLGNLFGNFHYEEEVLYTNLQFQSSGIDSLKKSDMLLIGTIPINLSMSSSAPLFPDDDEIDMYLVTNKLPLRLVSLIIPELENITGNADVNVHVFGSGKAPEIEGYATLNKSNFTLRQNGMTYTTQGRIDITTKDIKLAMNIDNLPSDRKDGRIDITGLIKMVDLKIDDIDISAKGQLQILQKEKRKSNNELYGDLLIAMTGDGIKYTQNFSNKTGNILTGNIVVKDANLVLPLTAGSGSASLSNDYRFIVIDDTSRMRADSNAIKKLLMKQIYEKYISDKKEYVKPSTMNKLGFRFDVKTLGNIKIEIPMDPLYGEALIAEIGGNFTLMKSGENIAIYGSADIGEKSYYKFATKKFEASGKINFTGALDNPELNIKATYEGTHINKEDQDNPKDETVVITITIGGTLAKPSTKYEMTVDSKIRDKGDVFGDIISFVLTGSFNDEMTTDQKQSLAGKYQSSLYSIGSGVISGKLTEFFKNEFEFIRSVETEYSGDLASTNVKISGEIGNTAIFRLGGKVFSDIGNANINLELPVGKIVNDESLRNLIFEIYRTANESTKKSATDVLLIYGTRIFYRINF